MNVVIITQARMNSTRLPGKVMKTVLGKPLLEYHLERLRRSRLANQVVVATTVNESDQVIVDLCHSLCTPAFRGPEDDVLARFHDAALQFDADVVVRVTSDCPLIDPALIDRALGMFVDGRQYDFVSNTLERTYPRGMDVEVFSFQSLEEAHHKAQTESDREHVTPFIYRQPDRYRLGNFTYSRNCGEHRWTVDTTQDFTLIQKMLEELYPRDPEFSLESLLELIEMNPDWSSINAHIEQKKLGE